MGCGASTPGVPALPVPPIKAPAAPPAPPARRAFGHVPPRVAALSAAALAAELRVGGLGRQAEALSGVCGEVLAELDEAELEELLPSAPLRRSLAVWVRAGGSPC